MQNHDNKKTEEHQAPSKLDERPRIKVSDLSKEKVSDLNNMFGMWKEADHCDKDWN